MEIEVVERKDNKLLRREEMYLMVSSDGTTPSREEIKQRVVAEFDLNPDLTLVDRITQRFGSRKVRCYIKVYKDRKWMERVENKYKLLRNKLVEEKEEEKK
ncbi:MAG: 30S ribosomal protein S24e [Methanobacteriota archaeon]|nr:MAG: 30S ribosomal protein S24e [Euryarchaeota archaeon]